MARGKRIDPSQQQLIQRMLAAGHTPTSIALEVGVGLETVRRIRRKTYGRTAYRKCSVCGGLVRPPCILCRTRREMGLQPG